MTSITPNPNQLNSRERYSASFRSAIEKEAENDESKSPNGSTLWETIHGYILTTNYRYTSGTPTIAELELDMRDLWHVVVQAARITEANDPAQDRLVSQLLYAHSMGTIRRKTTATEEEGEEAVTPSEGARIWTDLPYLAKHMREAWERSTDLSPTHRHNLAAFTARATALGVRGPDLSVCALWLLRAALETARPLTRVENSDEVPIAELLPACIAWFRYCNHKLLTLAVNSHVFPALEPHLSEPGELAHTLQPGFSVARWLFWRQRFKELSRCGAEEVAKDAGGGFSWMISAGREMGYEIPGEANYAAEVAKALTDELKRSGKNCVTSDEIVIDLDWAD